MPGIIVDGFDFFAVHEAASEAIAPAREGGGPTLIEMKFTSLLGHFEGDQQTYRASEVEHARAELDCLRRFAGRDRDRELARPTSTRRRRGRGADRPGRSPTRRPHRCLRRRTCSPTSTCATDGGSLAMARNITYREALNEALTRKWSATRPSS